MILYVGLNGHLLKEELMIRSVKKASTRKRMESLGWTVWVNEDLDKRINEELSAYEALVDTMADHYTRLQLENPELLACRIKKAWLKILSEKPDYLLAEEAEKLGIF
jgi:hypothetical protein